MSCLVREWRRERTSESERMVRGIVATRTIFWYYGGWEGSLAPVSVIDISMQCMLKGWTDLLAKKFNSFRLPRFRWPMTEIAVRGGNID